MTMKFIICNVLLYVFSITLYCQEILIDARIRPPDIKEGHLKMGNPGPDGSKITVNNRYLLLGGKPMLPVMGEIHFSRINRDKWEDVILKMKANGINIIATYVFWIHHEESEGVFDWSDNKDLRSFVRLCGNHGLWVYPRIGPWCHGEVRNGGLPDWIMKRKDFTARTNDPGYLYYADRWYREIGRQLEGLYYKYGGPVIGIQLENEYWRGKAGEEHILWLKHTAMKYGMDVPLYTVTGWKNASVPENEVIPLWGGYPAAPWNSDVKKIETNENYIFRLPMNSQLAADDNNPGRYRPDYTLYPYLTCELGIGNQLSDHRRPVINAIDGLAISTASIASGSNLVGYYVFAGGHNPVGKYTTLEEDRLETGYWNEYPDISYDFQAAIRETGEITLSYQKLKKLHYFLNDFGEQLASMIPVIPTVNDDPDALQYSLRVNGNAGFLFVSNYYRGYDKTTKKNMQFKIVLQNEELTIPSKPVDIADSAVFFWAVNMKIGKSLLKYATAQPICKIDNANFRDWYFFRSRNINPEFLFAADSIVRIDVNGRSPEKTKNGFLLTDLTTGLESPVIIRTADGLTERIFILSEKQADQFWLFKTVDRELAFLSGAGLIMDEEMQINAFSVNPDYNIIALNSNLSVPAGQGISVTGTGGFSEYSIQNKKARIDCKLSKSDILEDSEWLTITPAGFDSGRVLFHKLFFKNFSLENSAGIRKASFYLIAGEKCNIRINGQWVNQPVEEQRLNKLDLTGYVKRGFNDMLFDFLFTKDKKAFAGALEVEFNNSDKITITTDSSWLTAEQYTIPAPWDEVRHMKIPEIADKPVNYEHPEFTPYRYSLYLNGDQVKNFSNVYLRINYLGNKAQCRSGSKLTADNFNNGTTWSFNLTDIDMPHGYPLVIELQPFQDHKMIYFDRQPVTDLTTIDSIAIEPEYSNSFTVNIKQ